MTWFGKILTFVVLIASVVWMYFSVEAFIGTNWKNRAEGLEAQLKEAEVARVADYAGFGRPSDGAQGSPDHRAGPDQGPGRRQQETLRQPHHDRRRLRKMQRRLRQGRRGHEAPPGGEGQPPEGSGHHPEPEQDPGRHRGRDLRVEVENAKKEEVRSRNAASFASAIADDYARKIEDLMLKTTSCGPAAA